MDGCLLFAPPADSGLLKLSKLTAKFKRRYIVIASAADGYVLSVYKTRPRGGKPDPIHIFSMLRFAAAYITDDKPPTLIVAGRDCPPAATPTASSNPTNVLRLARSSRLPSSNSSAPVLMFRNDPDLPNQLDSWQRFITNVLRFELTPSPAAAVPIVAPPVQPQAGAVDVALSRLGPSVAHLSMSSSSPSTYSSFDGHTIRPVRSNRGWDAQSASTTASSHLCALSAAEDAGLDSRAVSPVAADRADQSHLSILDRALRQRHGQLPGASTISGVLDRHASMPPDSFAAQQRYRPFPRRNTSASTTVSSIHGKREPGLPKAAATTTTREIAGHKSPAPPSPAEIRDIRRSSIISFINPTTVGGTDSNRNSLNDSRPSTSSNDTENLLLALKNRYLFSERDPEDSISIRRRSVQYAPVGKRFSISSLASIEGKC
ncbi:hypothetical protein NEOLI_001056 [Neolecta irregularis DAH-3]|uniref:PH domain-containing protein n=1 Tax=Neolecta irregularis (strain DAH-3) TaxID=1198029 RepID=A0A1U7LP11_NEOID|nr:hypothetical protein NEOLI_001056 [Neolecta irregularis DAH-3]|eukprot:OLL24261.1 hypothetical protein NEOLI_001056 [Neolecta irregularis DAH-3]